MFSFLDAIILGLLQGASELFPISSLGHSVIVPKLLSWNINQHDNFFLVFLVATHFATATVLLVFFRRDWGKIIRGLFRSFRDREIKSTDADANLAWLLIIGTIPAGILGLLFEDSLKNLFASPETTAFFLIGNGFLLLAAEVLRRSPRPIKSLTWPKSVVVGLFQTIALIPGFSRTGSTLAGGLLVGLSHEDAARFSFLLATPIIGAAAILKLPELLTPAVGPFVPQIFIGAIFAAIAAYLSVKFLTKYFKTETLTPFALYCLLAGTLSLLLFALKPS